MYDARARLRLQHFSTRHPEEVGAEEFSRLLSHLHGTYGLVARLLYGSGLRLLEVAQGVGQPVSRYQKVCVPEQLGPSYQLTQ